MKEKLSFWWLGRPEPVYFCISSEKFPFFDKKRSLYSVIYHFSLFLYFFNEAIQN